MCGDLMERRVGDGGESAMGRIVRVVSHRGEEESANRATCESVDGCGEKVASVKLCGQQEMGWVSDLPRL